MVVYNIKLSKHGAFRWHTSNVSGSQLSYTPIFTFLPAHLLHRTNDILANSISFVNRQV